MTRRDTAVIEARVVRLRERLIDRGAASVVPRPAVAYGDLIVERARPFGVILYLVMVESAGTHESEAEALRGALRTLTDGRMSGASVQALVAELDERLRAGERAACLEEATTELSASTEDAELAVALAAAMAVADGEVDEGERRAVLEVAELLGVGPKRLAALLGNVASPG